MQFSIRLASRSTWRVLVTLAVLLALGHGARIALDLALGYDTPTLRLLDLNEERSFGTIFSVAVLVANAAVLTIFAFAARRSGKLATRDSRWWAGLAVLFLFLSADEVLGIHESVAEPVQRSLHTSGALEFAWVVPYAGLVIAVATLYTRFLLRLPRSTAVRFVTAGAVYVGGAMGMEMVAGHMVDAHGYSERSLPMELEYLVEESMEMLGAIYFLTALLRHVELRGAPLVFVVSMPDARVRSPCAGESDIPS